MMATQGPRREVTEGDAISRLRAKITYGYKIKDMAGDFGVSPSFMSMVLAGKKPMTEKMLASIGVRRETLYFEVETPNDRSD